jgi:tetratricopeptide (TPR) repeat protein
VEMAVLRVFLAGLIIFSLTMASSPLAEDDFDLLSLIPGISGKKSGDVEALRQMFTRYAQQSEAQVAQADKSQVLTAIDPYPDDWEAYRQFTGQALPLVTVDETGADQVTIATRADAFYVVGAAAVTQANRLVALWCFCEAARRVPLAVTYLNNAAFALMEFGYYQDALRALEFAISRAPEFTSLYVNRGSALEGLGQYAQAAENYQKAFNDFPANGDYCRLLAAAYHQAGQDEQAWIYGQWGKQNFPDLLDWNAFLTSLNFTVPVVPSIPLPLTECLYNLSCSTLYSDFVTFTAYFMDDYKSKVYQPAMSDNTLKVSDAAETYHKSINECGVDSCCFDKISVKYYQSLVLLDSEKYAIEKEYWLVFRDGYEGNADKIKSEITSRNLPADQANFLTSTIDAYRFLYLQNEINNLQKISDQMKDHIHLIDYHLEAMKGSCNPVSLPGLADLLWMKWVLTAKITPGLEGTLCLTLVCVSVDAVSGDIGLRIGEGFVVKFTKNAFTHDLGVNIGVGFQGGLGPANLEGVIYYKFKQNQVGVEPSFNFLGMGRLKFFVGFERLGA